MDEAKEKILDFKASDVEACRICLATDVKMYSLQDTHLGPCMESIGGFTKSCDGLPNYVCYECAPILIKCNKLIEKSKTAQATLLDIFNKNGQINKPLIQEQKKTELNLQSSLDSYLLLNYFYIKYNDDTNTSDFIKMESDPTKLKINLKNEIKEESSDEASDSDILKIFKDLSKEEESDKDSDVEAIEVKVPVVEIVSDDETIGDDFISLKSYKVKMDTCVEGLLAHDDDIPRYHKPTRLRPIGVAKQGKKKKKKKTVPIDTSHTDSYIKRFFNIHPTPSRSTWKYTCKFCPDTFNYVNDARDHTFIGCQKPQRSNVDRSTVPNPGSESNSVQLNQPNVWKEWPGGSK